MTTCGAYWSPFFLVNVVNGAVLQKIIALLSMRCFGYFAQALPGVIFRLILVTGRIRIVVLAGGVMPGYGRSFWRYWLMILILNG
jgi:hypothetical protein